jgi:glycosyltransferase involved in cell wall biosynthesis
MVGGNPQELAREERRLGLESRALAFEESPFHYATDEVLWHPGDSRLRREWKRWHLLWRAWHDFDIIHFNFGATIMPQHLRRRPATAGWRRHVGCVAVLYTRLVEMLDVSLLKRAGKGIEVTFQGDDARQGDYCRRHFAITHAREVEPGYFTPDSDAQKRRRIERFDRCADRIYALNPDLLRVLPARAQFLPYSTIDLKQCVPVLPRPGTGQRLRVLHAPSHRGVKGTRYLQAAVERLRQDGVDFEFMLVEGLSNADARRLYGQVDLLVDQLLAGWYGGLAVELMAMGKPVICYLREEDLHFLPRDMRQTLPIIQATPATIYAVLKEWLTTRRSELALWGRHSRAYVERWHNPEVIAAELKQTYEAILTRTVAA